MNLDNLVTAIVLIVVFYILFFIGKLVHDRLQKEYDLTEELVEKDNPALCLAVAGYYFGLILCIGGALVGPSHGIGNDILDLFIYGILGIILLNISWFLCDKAILPKFRITDELIRDQNQGTGAVSCGISVASGLIVYGSVSGEGGTVWTAIIFWIAGQIMLVLAAYVYNLITPYDIHTEIEKDNVAAGVSFAGALTGTGLIIGLAARTDFESWSDLGDFIIIAIVGLALLPLVRFLTDKVLLPTVKLTDEIAMQEKPNVGAAYIEASSYVAAAFVICWCV